MTLPAHQVVSREQWLAARDDLLTSEKEYTRQRDRLNALRRTLPWVRIDKDYLFGTTGGPRSLGKLFEDKSQLFIYHFMFAPGTTQPCIGCSFVMDHLHGIAVHLEHHDVKLTAVSRAPLEELQRYRKRMGWSMDWASSAGSDFNYDFGVSFTPAQVAGGLVNYNYRQVTPWGPEAPGMSVFVKDESGAVFHTYSTYARGAEAILGAYGVLDMMPAGRNEGSRGNTLASWVKRHDEYAVSPSHPPAAQACCD